MTDDTTHASAPNFHPGNRTNLENAGFPTNIIDAVENYVNAAPADDVPNCGQTFDWVEDEFGGVVLYSPIFVMGFMYVADEEEAQKYLDARTASRSDRDRPAR